MTDLLRRATPAVDALVAQVHAALAAGRDDDAVALAQSGVGLGLEHPLLLNLVAHALQVEGRFEEALARLEQARRMAPQDAFILCATGGCLSQQGLDAQALQMYDLAIRDAPRHAQAHHGRGLALGALDDDAGATAAHQRAVDLDPGYPDAWGALADHALRRGDLGEARACADRALAADPLEPSATLTLAFLDVKTGRPAPAAERLETRLAEGRLSPLHLSALAGLQAEALDLLGQPAEAFAAHIRANDALQTLHAPLLARSGVESGVELCRRLQARFEGAEAVDWAPTETAEPPGPARRHVFLVGFVRSGTTLLEQVLASHPDVVALEEKPLLRSLAEAYFRDAPGLDALSRLGAGPADAMRAAYWRQVRGHGVEPLGRVFVDKNPLDAIWLPLVAKLFPDARILVARRDPRDVVVSSIRHRFRVSALTYAFTGLRSAAEFYAAVMALTETYRARLPLRTHVHRHEDLVDDFDGEVRAICRFLDLDWSDSLRDFAATARRRDIRTPSAEQVRGGLSREGLARWRRYEAQLAPVAPILAPWVEAFGYAP